MRKLLVCIKCVKMRNCWSGVGFNLLRVTTGGLSTGPEVELHNHFPLYSVLRISDLTDKYEVGISLLT